MSTVSIGLTLLASFTAMPSLQRRLAWWLVGPLVVLAALSAIPAYYIASDAANNAYDQSLLDPALALAKYVRVAEDGVRLELPAVAIEALRIDTSDRVYYSIVGPDGKTVAGNADLPIAPVAVRGNSPVFFDANVGNEPARLVAVRVPSDRGVVTVEVAETRVKRIALVREVLFGMIVPELIVVLAAAVLLTIGIRLGLAPLERLRGELSERSPADLRPVAEHGVPQEVRPLVAGLNQLLARLRATLDSQQQFIANAAHQLRTPLAGLSAHAELALREPATGELRRLLQTMHGETQRTTHLVNQLLALARAEPGAGTHATQQPVNLEEVVSQGASEWVHRALARNIDLGFDLHAAWTVGEALLLRELAANLIDNAITYTQAGGTVTVRTRTTADTSLLEVEDDGPGIPEAERARVFERFYRIPGTAPEGCGLGLAIVRDIAMRHGGTVTIDAAAPLGGTHVRVSFAQLKAEVRPPPEPAAKITTTARSALS